MKILQVITSLLMGGAEKLIVDMTLILTSKGYKVDVFVFNGVSTPFLLQLKTNNINVIQYNKGASPYLPSNIYHLAKLIPQYDIVHTHNTACQYYVALAKKICRCKGVHFITTEHNTTNRRRTLFGFKYIDKWMYDQYDKIISISDKATENLQAFVGSRTSIKTIYNGINLQHFIQAKTLIKDIYLKRTNNDFIICMVAAFREQKDQDTLIKSLEYLPNNCVLWLIGDGERKFACEALVQKLGLSNRVVFAGIRTDIPAILKTSDVIVMSSHWEGLSLSSIEGMSVGKPFIASDVDGLHEIVEGNGILFPHQDEKALADVILGLMEKPEKARMIAKKCFDKACQYDISKTVNAYLEVYKQLRI